MQHILIFNGDSNPCIHSTTALCDGGIGRGIGGPWVQGQNLGHFEVIISGACSWGISPEEYHQVMLKLHQFKCRH